MKQKKKKDISAHDLIIKTFKEISCMKQDVLQNTYETFKELKVVLKKMAENYQKEVKCFDDRIIIEYKEKGKYEAELKFAGDILIFYMHSNIFNFDNSHTISK